jgi:hypothetical protein
MQLTRLRKGFGPFTSQLLLSQTQENKQKNKQTNKIITALSIWGKNWETLEPTEVNAAILVDVRVCSGVLRQSTTTLTLAAMLLFFCLTYL